MRLRATALSAGSHRGLVFSAPAASLPANTVAPVVSGIGYVGQTLATTNGTWTGNPAPTFAYQWQRNGSNIGGATASTYVVTLADEGVPVRCVVTATNSEGSASANSNAIEQWVPSDLGASLQALWDAEDTSTITIAGSKVSAWADKVAGVVISQASAAIQPAWSTTGGVGGRNGVVFNRTTAQRLASTAAVGSIFRNVPGMVTFAVARRDVVPASGSERFFLVSHGGSTFAGRAALSVPGLTNQIRGGSRILDANSAVELLMPGTPTGTSDSVFLSHMDCVGAQGRGMVNGTIGPYATGWQTASAGNTSNTDPQTLSMGNLWTGGSEAPNGPISAVGLFAGNITDADIDRIAGWAAHRWGFTASLPAGHAYKTEAPTP
jgi:hypothetical protein